MAIYDGFVSLGEGDVHVILAVEEESVTLSANGTEIGNWSADEVSIRYMGRGIYAITAENDTLEFVPSDRDLFAIRFGEINDDDPISVPNGSGRHTRAGKGPRQLDSDGTVDLAEAPPPGPITKFAFYALVGVTALLGLWAMLSIILS